MLLSLDTRIVPVPSPIVLAAPVASLLLLQPIIVILESQHAAEGHSAMTIATWLNAFASSLSNAMDLAVTIFLEQTVHAATQEAA
jgi:hypothetical protein